MSGPMLLQSKRVVQKYGKKIQQQLASWEFHD